jgi:hypothetical protein
MANTRKPLPASLVQTSAPQPDQHAELLAAHTTDEFAGQGGSYIFDPATGKRTRQQVPETPPDK